MRTKIHFCYKPEGLNKKTEGSKVETSMDKAENLVVNKPKISNSVCSSVVTKLSSAKNKPTGGGIELIKAYLNIQLCENQFQNMSKKSSGRS